MSTPLPDAAERLHALDTSQSFIVQAPAGSGKTELLTQRVLALLAQVETPESIVAITFTKKAAAEMRQRIVERLREAQAGHANPLAQAVLARDAELGWQLIGHPNRLRVITIDAFLAGLTRQMPYLSRMGGSVQISDDMDALYQHAARETIANLESDDPIAGAVARVLTYLDNDAGRLENLLASMLARRDQWLPLALRSGYQGDAFRHVLEAGLATAVQPMLDALTEHFPARWQHMVMPAARYAAANVGADSPITALLDWQTPLTANSAHIAMWHALADLFLTKHKADWRARVDKNIGLDTSAASAPHKQTMQEMLDSLAGNTAAATALSATRNLPPTCYSDAQWHMVAALFQVLRQAAVQLQLTFAQQGETDYAAVQMAAKQALGDDDAPTDLALALDYRIQHLLVDEFQDTSVSQFQLLAALTRGWQAGDGRTLFLVGDPMQSIYRFRMAEVGLFLQAAQMGIGSVALQPLALCSNFRSAPALVDWVNRAFTHAFPRLADEQLGAIPYSPAMPARPANSAAQVTVHPVLGNNAAAEAAQVLQIIQTQQQADPTGSIAILVRGRSHLRQIIPVLQNAGLRFQAVEIDTLSERQHVQDFISLTRAWLLPADRVHWLALLRSPLVGLTLADLHTLCAHRRHSTLWVCLADDAQLAQLSTDGQTRAQHVRQVFAAHLAQRGRLPTAETLRRLWQQLGGFAAWGSSAAQQDILTCLDHIAKMDTLGQLTVDTLADKLTALFAASDSVPQVQVMTIHKSKGLEFDTVILPGLGRRAQGDGKRLMSWLELADGELVVAPIDSVGGDKDPICQFISGIEREKSKLESARVLYVAATRARQQLHLLGAANLNKEGDVKPTTGSLLEHLWPVVGADYLALADAQGPALEATTDAPLPQLRRLPLSWYTTQTRVHTPASAYQPKTTHDAPTTGPADIARVAGIVAHRVLQQIGEDGLAHWPATRLASIGPVLQTLAQREGLPTVLAQRVRDQVLQILPRVLADPDAHWLLGPHTDTQREWALASTGDDVLNRKVIDLAFVDEHGTRWIVDYKTDQMADGETEGAFIARCMAIHRQQLVGYRDLLKRLEDKPVKLALYLLVLPRLLGVD